MVESAADGTSVPRAVILSEAKDLLFLATLPATIRRTNALDNIVNESQEWASEPIVLDPLTGAPFA